MLKMFDICKSECIWVKNEKIICIPLSVLRKSRLKNLGINEDFPPEMLVIRGRKEVTFKYVGNSFYCRLVLNHILGYREDCKSWAYLPEKCNDATLLCDLLRSKVSLVIFEDV